MVLFAWHVAAFELHSLWKNTVEKLIIRKAVFWYHFFQESSRFQNRGT